MTDSFSSNRSFGVYEHPNVDPRAHAKYIAQLAGCGGPVYCDFVPKRGCDDNPLLKKYIFIRPPEKMWRKQLKYVRKKSNEKKFVPVSCSKNCTECHGCSPGCGGNHEFEEIKADFNPSPEIWKSLRSPPSKTHPYKNCVILYL